MGSLVGIVVGLRGFVGLRDLVPASQPVFEDEEVPESVAFVGLFGEVAADEFLE